MSTLIERLQKVMGSKGETQQSNPREVEESKAMQDVSSNLTKCQREHDALLASRNGLIRQYEIATDEEKPKIKKNLGAVVQQIRLLEQSMESLQKSLLEVKTRQRMEATAQATRRLHAAANRQDITDIMKDATDEAEDFYDDARDVQSSWA